MDFEAMRNFRNTHNPYAQRQGIYIETVSPGAATVTKTVTADDLNPVNVPHGGVYFTLADTACGSAAATHGFKAVTVNCSYNFLRSAKVGDTLTAVSEEIKGGRTLSVYAVRITDQNGALLGEGTFTFYHLPEKMDV